MIDPQEGDQGRRVVYRIDAPFLREAGKVVRWNEHYVFVIFERDNAAKACLRASLVWEPLPDAQNEPTGA